MFVSILVFLLVLSILILVHEFGHFIMARKFGVWVEEFGFGLPPRIIGKKIGETLYSLNLLPFGGFVKLHGEDSEEKIKNPKRAFINKSKKKRLVIIVAGVVMNFLLAIICFGIVYSFSGIPRDTKNVKVVEVIAGSPAQTAGLIVGDIVKKVGKIDVVKVSEFVKLVEESKGK
ncbi:MAG: site-2 protease family protein, partial [bacterium]